MSVLVCVCFYSIFIWFYHSMSIRTWLIPWHSVWNLICLDELYLMRIPNHDKCLVRSTSKFEIISYLMSIVMLRYVVFFLIGERKIENKECTVHTHIPKRKKCGNLFLFCQHIFMRPVCRMWKFLLFLFLELLFWFGWQNRIGEEKKSKIQ